MTMLLTARLNPSLQLRLGCQSFRLSYQLRHLGSQLASEGGHLDLKLRYSTPLTNRASTLSPVTGSFSGSSARGSFERDCRTLSAHLLRGNSKPCLFEKSLGSPPPLSTSLRAVVKCSLHWPSLAVEAALASLTDDPDFQRRTRIATCTCSSQGAFTDSHNFSEKLKLPSICSSVLQVHGTALQTHIRLKHQSSPNKH